MRRAEKVAVLALLGAMILLALIGHLRVESTRREAREAIDGALTAIQDSAIQPRSYVQLPDGRVFWQGVGESREDWAARVMRVVRGLESMAGYICTTLTGCDIPGGSVEVCTPCNSQPPSQQCRENHALDVAVFCAAFDCTDCGD